MAEQRRLENEEENIIARRREKRVIQPIVRYEHSNLIAYAFNVEMAPSEGEPSTYEEAMSSKEASKWREAMEEEMRSSFEGESYYGMVNSKDRH